MNAMNRIKTVLIGLVIVMGCGKKGNDPGQEVTPKMNFDDVSMNEGTGGTKNVELKFTLDRATSKQVSFTYSTADASAKSGSDFTGATNQTVTFQANEIEKTVLISIVTDDLKE